MKKKWRLKKDTSGKLKMAACNVGEHMLRVVHHTLRVLHWSVLLETCVLGHGFRLCTQIISRFFLNLRGASQKRLDAVLSAAEYSWLSVWMLSNKPPMIIVHDNLLFYQLLILTHSAGLLVGESCLQWPPWMRCRCTSSSADGSVQKWSAVFIFVYSKAQGPTGEIKGKCSGCSLNSGSATFRHKRCVLYICLTQRGLLMKWCVSSLLKDANDIFHSFSFIYLVDDASRDDFSCRLVRWLATKTCSA